uniref:Uncharacterized protein n=1 Tax=Glossina morsitans morsitans TaxID=37546 RepID=A0A1B0FM23_GLOMM
MNMFTPKILNDPNVNEASVSYNQCRTGISENYHHWDEDDNDLFVSISTQEIPVNKQITQGNQRNNKNLLLRESNVTLGLQKASGERQELGEGKNAVGANETLIENELEVVKNKMHQHEMGKVNNPVSSLVSTGFSTANGKKISISEEGQKSVQNILRQFQDNLQETDYETELKDIKAWNPSLEKQQCANRKQNKLSSGYKKKRISKLFTRKRLRN